MYVLPPLSSHLPQLFAITAVRDNEVWAKFSLARVHVFLGHRSILPLSWSIFRTYYYHHIREGGLLHY